MRRREFIALLGGTVVAWPWYARAEQRAMPVVGLLSGASADSSLQTIGGLRLGLREGGFVEGRDFTIEYRWAEGRFDRLPALAGTLVGRGVALIVTVTMPAALAATAASRTTPVIFVVGEDPVKAGLVTSLNRPGGNATGVSDFINQLVAKRLEILQKAVPGAASIGWLVNPANPNAEPDVKEAEAAAHALKQKLLVVKASSNGELDSAFMTLTEEHAGAVCVDIDPFLIRAMEQIIALAARHGLPAIYPVREFVGAGGLMSYGPNRVASWRQAGIYAARILRGEKAADLPVQQAESVELLINLRTARALGLSVPPSLIARADEVIE
jgi:putative tryptophan/tyrosine transport system substrate-binding protein